MPGIWGQEGWLLNGSEVSFWGDGQTLVMHNSEHIQNQSAAYFKEVKFVVYELDLTKAASSKFAWFTLSQGIWYSGHKHC
jgi:hypothetical protein